MGLVWLAGPDAVGVAGAERSLLVPDAQRHRAAQDQPELLVGVAVLGHGGAGIELDHGQGEALAVDRAGQHPVEQGLWPDRGEFVEGAHSRPQPSRAALDSCP